MSVNEPEQSPLDEWTPDESTGDQLPLAPVEPAWQRHTLGIDDEAGLDAAVKAVRAGEVIVIPTDTVYGVAADATSPEAVQRLLNAKVRGRDMPPPVLISDAIMLGSLADEVPESVHALTAAHWPGALTVILKAQSSLGMDLGETEGTIAVRVPNHDGARALLRRTGPLAVSSANISGNPAATTVDEAIDQLGESISVYLDGGPTPGLAPSSIVDFSTNPDGRLVRLGALTIEQLTERLPQLDLGEFAPQPSQDPGTPVELAESDDDATSEDEPVR
ncbi:L-threonylcarbamoyladenylate synthase [Aestuariimicrobium kwangyangense]|uniref:L-threonylcarbamoyladenylate synthase n=1 Tax=Aestuariimicrobium kwangyangense TaxID=396389 RepID=UPI0003B3DC1A|nr:L-threonylcarbamoyladenylate synthase [Aestuariimicrobium kwangyangense]